MAMKKKRLWICLLLSIFFLKNEVVLAQETGKGFSITPFFQEISLEQNQAEARFFVTIENSTEAPAIFRLNALDFGTLDESGGVAFAGASDFEKKYSLASWISLEKDAIALNPKEKQNILIKIENKESLTPGGHYGAIFLKIESDEKLLNEDVSKISFNPALSSLIFVRKLGGETYGLDLKNHDLQDKFWEEPKKINLRFQNTGNVHNVPRGIVRVVDPLQREVSRGIINEESAIILPETFRIFSTSLKKVAPMIVPGKYTIMIEYRYDGKDDFASKKFSTNLLPTINTIILLIAGIAIVGFFKIRNKKTKTTN